MTGEIPDLQLPDKEVGAATVNLSSQDENEPTSEDNSRDENDGLMVDENANLSEREEELGKTDEAVPSKRNMGQVKNPLPDSPNQPIRKQYTPRTY